MFTITKERLVELKKMSIADFARGVDAGKISKDERQIFLGIKDFKIAGAAKKTNIVELTKKVPAKKLKKSDGRLQPKFIAHLRRLAKARHLEAVSKHKKKSSRKPLKSAQSTSASTSKRGSNSTKKAS